VRSLQVRAFAAPRAGLPLVEPAALAREPCLLYGAPVDEATLRWRSETGQARQVCIVPTVVADDLGTLLAIARAGNGVVFAPDFTARADIAAGALVDTLPGWRLLVPEGDAMQALMLPQAETSEAARRLVHFVRDALTGPNPGPNDWQQWLPSR
jgi:DNA-binding transcriptional LysR family regulator